MRTFLILGMSLSLPSLASAGFFCQRFCKPIVLCPCEVQYVEVCPPVPCEPIPEVKALSEEPPPVAQALAEPVSAFQGGDTGVVTGHGVYFPYGGGGSFGFPGYPVSWMGGGTGIPFWPNSPDNPTYPDNPGTPGNPGGPKTPGTPGGHVIPPPVSTPSSLVLGILGLGGFLFYRTVRVR